MERLDKVLANTGRWSRREVKELCRAGRVQVNGTAVKHPEQKVGPEASVTVNGEPVEREETVLMMLHKPAGVVSATEDARETTVLSLLPERYQRIGLFPVGRLDKDTEGLLLLTNDGSLAHELLSPKKHVDKRYYVEVDGVLDESDCSAFSAGMILGDGTRCRPASLKILGSSSGEVTLHEGKYHQVKRMLAARGKPVLYLKRISFGPLELDSELPKGAFRPLKQEERESLEHIAEKIQRFSQKNKK